MITGMHVLAIVPLYPPESRVGAWLATHGLLRYLVDQGHSVDVVPYRDNPGMSYTLGGVRVRPVGEIDQAIETCDVILTHAGVNGNYHKLARSTGKPLVIMVHGSATQARSLQGASLVVCNSEATKSRLPQSSSPQIVVHPYTNRDDFTTTSGDSVTLVNLMSQKGGDVFWNVAQVMPDVSFLGVLGGYGQQVVRNSHNVEVIATTGRMRDDVYSRTKVLLMPSMAESWGMVAVEAMASGIPVIAKPTPGLRECLGSAATWVDSVATGPWVAAVRSTIEPETWKIKSQASLDRVDEISADDHRPLFMGAIESLVGGAA